MWGAQKDGPEDLHIVRTMNAYEHTGRNNGGTDNETQRPSPLSSLVWGDDDASSDDAMTQEGFGKEEGSDIQQCC